MPLLRRYDGYSVATLMRYTLLLFATPRRGAAAAAVTRRHTMPRACFAMLSPAIADIRDADYELLP